MALSLLEKVLKEATWRNLHWLPHQILVYEIRVPEGYGMRWSQDRNPEVEPVVDQPEEGVLSVADAKDGPTTTHNKGPVDFQEAKDREGVRSEIPERPWVFRGFVEPMIENGHELRWRH